MSCTGIAASWCPVCGSCSCVWPEDQLDGKTASNLAEARYGWLRNPRTGEQHWGPVEQKLRHRGVELPWNGALHRWVDPACPLHGEDSKHAERPDLFDVLDEVAAELKADGVLVSYEDFRRNLAFWED